MAEKKYFICRKTRMLQFLRNKGFIPVDTLPDLRNPKFYVWQFEETPELIKARDEWFEMVAEYKAKNGMN